jgi:PAS domain S-box-containing protein
VALAKQSDSQVAQVGNTSTFDEESISGKTEAPQSRRQKALLGLAETVEVRSDFLRTAVKLLSEGLDCMLAAVGEIKNDNKEVQLLAMYTKGEFSEPHTYKLTGTPCEKLYYSGSIKPYAFCGENLSKLFPQDSVLKKLGASGYRAEVILDGDGNQVGHVFILDNKEIVDDPNDLAFFRVVSQRIGAEINRWRTEDLLMNQKAKFSDYAQSSSDWFWETDVNGKLILETDGNGKLILESEYLDFEDWHVVESPVGKTREEVAGDFLNKTDWTVYQTALEERLPFKNFDYCYPGANVALRCARISGRPIFGEDGAYIGHRGAATNITDIKLAELALRQSEEHFRSLVEGSLQGIQVFIDERVVYSNKAATRILEYSDDEIIGIHDDDIAAPEYVEELRQFRKNRSEGVREIIALRKDGSHFNAQSFVTNIFWNGVPARLVTFLDVTERKHTEGKLIQAQKMEAVGQLTSGIAHDFNNHLTVISGNAEMLTLCIKDDPDAQCFSAQILSAVGRASSLTSRLLTFSRQQNPQTEVTDVASLIGNIEQMIRLSLGEAIELYIESDPDLYTVNIDSNELESALLNLAVNARHAMNHNGLLAIESTNVTLGYENTAQHDSPPGNYVEVTVRDTGSGMSDETLAKVFEPFYTTKDKGKGSGLGLNMIWRFAKHSGGFVTIESKLGSGTAIQIYLPQSVNGLQISDDQWLSHQSRSDTGVSATSVLVVAEGLSDESRDLENKFQNSRGN